MDEKDEALYQSAREGDAKATEALLLRHRKLVFAAVKHFLRRGAEQEDIIQAGMVGLLSAIRRFDPSKGYAFSTFAVPHIMGEMRRWVRKSGAFSAWGGYRSAVEACQKEHAAAHLGEAAKRVGLLPEEAAFLLSADMIDLPDDRAPEALETALIHADFDAAIQTLCEREREIVFFRYFKGESQTACAAHFGLSQAQISRIEKSILRRLRGRMGEAENKFTNSVDNKEKKW